MFRNATGARIGSITFKHCASPVTVERQPPKTAVGVIDPGAGLITFNRVKKTVGVHTFLQKPGRGPGKLCF